jgi:phosphoribosyl-AMP cyclohydrolase
MSEEWISKLKFDEKGLIAAVTVDDATGEVLMQAFLNKEALEKTLETGEVHYFTRSRGRLWRKGEESGHVQRLKGLFIDCDAPDCLLLRVEQVGGAACHTGHRSCFYRKLLPDGSFGETEGLVFDPKKVYKS